MYTSTTASRRSWGGVICLLFFATTLTIVAQSWSVRYGGSAITDVPSEKDLMIVKQIVHSEMLGVAWKPLVRCDNAYDHHARVWSQQVSVWADGDWKLAERELYTWDSNGELHSKTKQSWNGSMWENLERIRVSQDIDSGDRTRSRYTWAGGDWQLEGRVVERFNDEGRVESEREFTWCEDGWRACRLTVLLYDNEGFYSGYERYELADNFLYARSTATVSPCGQIGEEEHFTRVREGQWARSHRDRWTRDDCGLLTDLFVDEWRDGSWQPWKWDSYLTAPFTLAAEEPSPLSTFAIEPFPNPSEGNVLLQIHCSAPITAAIECVDILGRRLALLPARQFEAGATTLPLHLQSLPRGLVFLRLVDGNTVHHVQRLILR